jgi:hypothetical protein
VHCTYQIYIQPCVKVSVDARRRGLGTTWMRPKLDLRGRYAPSATILDTPTRNTPKHLTFPRPLLHHLHLVHVDVVPAATTKECSDSTCLCYRVVIIELLSVTTRLPEAGPTYTWQLSRTPRISPQTNTCLSCALCPHSCAPGKDCPVGHPSLQAKHA